MHAKNVDSERLKKMSDSKKSWGDLHVDHDVKNPDVYHELELIRSGKSMPPSISYKSYQHVHMAEDTNEKNKAYSRRQNKHEDGDIKTSAYIPRPGDNMPKPSKNHAQQKKPGLVLRFTQKDSGKFYWHDELFTIWIYPTTYGYVAVCEGAGTHTVGRAAYPKKDKFDKNPAKVKPTDIAKNAVLDLMQKLQFFSLDAAQNLPFFSKERVSVFKSVHILLAHKPRMPLPEHHQENFDVQHITGNFAFDMVERPIVEVDSLFIADSVNTVATDAHEPQPDEQKDLKPITKVKRFKKNRPIEPYQTSVAFKPTIIPHKKWHDDPRYK